eukprot:scaffold12086_cov160-Amphora_coffeaeformis.AAC.2
MGLLVTAGAAGKGVLEKARTLKVRKDIVQSDKRMQEDFMALDIVSSISKTTIINLPHPLL